MFPGPRRSGRTGGAGCSLGLPSDPAHVPGPLRYCRPRGHRSLVRELLESKEENKDAATPFTVRAGPGRTGDPQGFMGWGQAGRRGEPGRKAGGPLPAPATPHPHPAMSSQPDSRPAGSPSSARPLPPALSRQRPPPLLHPARPLPHRPLSAPLPQPPPALIHPSIH